MQCPGRSDASAEGSEAAEEEATLADILPRTNAVPRPDRTGSVATGGGARWWRRRGGTKAGTTTAAVQRMLMQRILILWCGKKIGLLFWLLAFFFM
jgi:hypothetical protein